jgi:hypothetical protein
MSDRKYKQRGYQEDGGERRPASAPRPPRERGEAPRGRGLGAPTEDVFRCARCGEAAPVAAAAALDARCARCGSDLHTCTNCSAFDSGARFQCRREVPERVAPKDRANRCELFDARLRQEFAQEKVREGGDARAAFDALFKF